MSSTRSPMGTSSNKAGNSTRSELEGSMDPLHVVAVVAGGLLCAIRSLLRGQGGNSRLETNVPVHH